MAKPTTLSPTSSGVAQMRGRGELGRSVGGAAGGVAGSPAAGGGDSAWDVSGSAIEEGDSAFVRGVGSVKLLVPTLLVEASRA